jgi:hypothetical protein
MALSPIIGGQVVFPLLIERRCRVGGSEGEGPLSAGIQFFRPISILARCFGDGHLIDDAITAAFL